MFPANLKPEYFTVMQQAGFAARGIACTLSLLIVWMIARPCALAQDDRVVLIATTTSTENSGLTDYLLPEAEKDTGFDYRVIAVGTGKALQIARAGDVDVVLVHAKEDELEFVAAGHGVGRTEFMYNDFILVGPTGSAAAFEGAQSTAEVFRRIHEGKMLFVSRGDDSGTHKKELRLWFQAGVVPEGRWYREVGQSQGKTLQIASELDAITLSDRGTWLFVRDRLPLEIVYQGDSGLFNQYSIMSVNPDLHRVNYAGANALTAWVTSSKGQSMINRYKINGEQLFHANAR